MAFGQEPKINSLSLAFAGAKDNPLKNTKNAIERFDNKLSNVWLFAGSWAGYVERLDHVILQESIKPLCGILQARVKVQAGLVMLAGELDGLLRASAQAEGFQNPELIERADDQLWFGQDGNNREIQAGDFMD